MLVFEGGGKPENLNKNPRSEDENQLQTRPTWDRFGNRTRTTAGYKWQGNKFPYETFLSILSKNLIVFVPLWYSLWRHLFPFLKRETSSLLWCIFALKFVKPIASAAVVLFHFVCLIAQWFGNLNARVICNFNYELKTRFSTVGTLYLYRLLLREPRIYFHIKSW